MYKLNKRANNMNIKQTAINLTSSTLSAIALVGVLALAPAQAKAEGLQNIFSAVIVGLVVNELYQDRTDKVNQIETVYGTSHNPLNESRRPGYAAGLKDYSKVCYSEVIRHQGYSEVVDTNCFGQVLDVKIVRR
jgi:hypothetical protein|tara:strand:+ start:890 stop:1291 length:402 start_codon:yes stop_codon:yes gene_type:complete